MSKKRSLTDICNPCRLSNQLIWCGGDIPELGVSNGDSYTEVINSINQAIQGESGNFIPLSGTEVGEPVTGFVEIQPTRGFFSQGGGSITFNTNGTVSVSNGIVLNGVGNSYGGGTFNSGVLFTGTTTFQGQLLTNSIFTNTAPHLTFIGDPTGMGIVGADYYGDNYTNNSFVQKEYVDVELVSADYGDTINVTGRNVQVFTNTIGSGQIGINLTSQIPVGALLFVSDLGNDATTNNIVIDAGVGNTILKGDGSSPSQTMVVDSSGTSYTIRKLTPNKWIVLGINQ